VRPDPLLHSPPPPPATPPTPTVETLSFTVAEGATQNAFFRRGAVAAHVLATAGSRPRIIVAFPAENSGIGVWLDGPLDIELASAVSAVERKDGMRGVRFTVSAASSAVTVNEAILSSIRVLRNYGHTHKIPKAVAVAVKDGPALTWARKSVDGGHGYELTIKPAAPARAALDGSKHGTILGPLGGEPGVQFEITALSSARPLTPIPVAELLNDSAARDIGARNALAFLSYREKLLAGSWRFLTYFGRDTLLSLRLLMPALKPDTLEAGLGAVLGRLDRDGHVAHEEDIGEWAHLEHSAQASYDYKMVDDDFMLAPVIAHYLLETAAGRARAETFLAQKTAEGISYRDCLRTNILMVLAAAQPYAETPGHEQLIRLKDGSQVGEWRDSNEGLGNGRIPYNVNVALVPAALEASRRLLASGLLGRHREQAAEAKHFAEKWATVDKLFEVRVPAEDAKARVTTYAKSLGVPAAAVEGELVYAALALDGAGAPIEVMHSDDSFAMLFTWPHPDRLLRMAQRILRPFPAGLRTPVGVVVANAAYATDPEVRKLFTAGHYHGAVVWSWQQAMLAAGLRRQIARKDIAAAVRTTLVKAEKALWDVIEATGDARTGELWSWKYEAGAYKLVPFGQGAGHQSESNAAQLWSTVYLAVRRPRR